MRPAGPLLDLVVAAAATHEATDDDTLGILTFPARTTPTAQRLAVNRMAAQTATW